MMGIFKTLRNAYKLAQRVEECEAKCDVVLTEWSDVLDKLKAREERERHRNRRVVSDALAVPAPVAPPEASPVSRKAQLRKQLRDALREASGGQQ
jgi:hypothetical protein